MAVKRRLDFGPATPAKNAQKLRKLEHTVYRRNLTEQKLYVKHTTPTAVANGVGVPFHLTDLAAGGNQGQRVGNDIRIKSIEVRGFTDVTNMDVYLVQSITGSAPAASNFEPVIHGHLTQGVQNDTFRVLSSNISPYQSTITFKLHKSWSIPMKTCYTGAAAGTSTAGKNQLYLICINRTGAQHNVSFSVCIKYFD